MAELLQKFDEAPEVVQFRTEGEEVILKQAAYPALRFHKRERDDLLQILIEFGANVVAGVATISLSSLEFLGGWLVSHFRNEDSCAAQFLARPVKGT